LPNASVRQAAVAINRSQRRLQMLFNGSKKKVNHIAGFTFKLKSDEALCKANYCS
jgi:hypothetical protein